MSTELATSSPSVSRIRLYGRICLWAGVLGAASGIYLAVVPPSVGPERYSYPLSAAGHQAIQAWFAIQHVGLILGLIALLASGALGTARYGRIGLYVALAGLVVLTGAELWAITAAEAAAGSAQTAPLDTTFGIASILAGAGLVVAGAAAARAGRWQGWARYLPLVLGIYVFVPMIPAIMGPFVAARLAIGGWMVLFAALGWELASQG